MKSAMKPAAPRASFLMKTAVLCSLAFAVHAGATVDHYTFKGTFWDSAVPSAIAAGDKFTLTFDLDTSPTDQNPDIQYAFFPNAVSNLVFSLDLGSTGNYAGGTMTASQFLQLTDNWFGYDFVNFTASALWLPTGLNFAPAGSSPFVEFTFNLYSSNTDTFNFTSGFGQTLDSVLPTLNLPSYDNSAGVSLVFGDWDEPQWAFSNITSITKGSVPDAPSYFVTIFAAIFIGVLVFPLKRLRANGTV
jgi:hypothetical protein